MKRLVLIMTVLILCVSGAAYAQTTMPVFCGDLAQADCDLLTQSQEAMSMLDSQAFDFSANVIVSDIPDMTDAVTVTVMGSGAYSGASSIKNDMAAMEADPGQAILSVLDNLDFDLSLTVTVPPELMSEVDTSMPNSLTLELRLVDGVGYLNLDTLQALLGDMGDSGMAGWNGIDLAGLVKALMKQMPDLFSGMMAGMDMNSSSMQTYMQEFSDPALMNEFVTIEKVDIGMPDETTFRMTIDFGALMSSPELQDMMRQQIEAQGQTLSQSEMDQAMAMSAAVVENMTFTIDETIGNDDFYVRSVHGTFDMDMAAIMAAMESSGAAGAGDEPAPVVTVDFTVFNNSFNSVPAITAPEDATVIPYQSLLSMIGGMSGMMQQQSG